MVKRIIGCFGATIILIGCCYALSQFFIHIFQNIKTHRVLNFDIIRLDLGRTIVLGLEFIIAADVIETMTAPDYYSLGVLALLVIIRTFSNYVLNKDINNIAKISKNN